MVPGSSMVEQEAVNFEVAGSSPVPGATNSSICSKRWTRSSNRVQSREPLKSPSGFFRIKKMDSDLRFASVRVQSREMLCYNMYMNGIQVGDIVTRSDGQQYMIIDDDFSAVDVPPEILQLPASLALARNLLGRHIGDNFNYNNQFKIQNITHSDYLKETKNKKEIIARKKKVEREAVDIKNALDKFDFRLAGELNRSSNIPNFHNQMMLAIQKLKRTIYDSVYDRKRSSEITKTITDAINAGCSLMIMFLKS